MRVRDATPQDMEAAAAVVRTSFRPEIARYMAYGQRGIAAFLKVFVQNPHLARDRVFSIAEGPDGSVEGFAEFRIEQETSSFLSYLCVAPPARGKGLARAMLRDFLDQRPQINEMRLDVFNDNTPAISLYQGMGFQPHNHTLWLAKPLPAPASVTPLIANLTTDQACFAMYGFSEIHLRRQGADVRLGRIGPEILRCFTLSDFEDTNLHAAARSAYPMLKEAILVASKAELGDLVDASLIVNSSTRMVWNQAQEFGSPQ